MRWRSAARGLTSRAREPVELLRALLHHPAKSACKRCMPVIQIAQQ